MRINKKLVISLAFCHFFLGIMAQSNFQVLSLDSIINTFEIINRAPIARMDLKKGHVQRYLEELPKHVRTRVDTSVLLEIIQNSFQLDTNYWKDSELRNAIIIDNSTVKIDSIYTLQKFSQVSKKKKRRLLKLIYSYNVGINSSSKTSVSTIWPTAYSRPIYDYSGCYAVIQKEHKSGRETSIYHFENQKWFLIGDIDKWAH